MRKDFLLALSLANLCLFSVWEALLPGSPEHFLMSAAPSRTAFVATMMSVVLLAVGMWSGATLVRRWGNRYARAMARWAFFAVVVVVLNVVRHEVPSDLLWGVAKAWPGGVRTALTYGLAAAAALALVRWQARVAQAAGVVLLVLFPFVVLTFARATWAVLTYESLRAEFANKPSSTRLAAHKTPHARVLWLVFDELDQRLTFAERPVSVRLPELDRLREEALYAVNAYPPAGWTIRSMPGLIVGRVVSQAQAAGPGELLLTDARDNTTQPWSAQASIFTRARDAGFNTAIIGWWQPYCRIIAGSVTRCSWYARDEWRALSPLEQSSRLLDDVPFAWRVQEMWPFKDWFERSPQGFCIQRYRQMLQDATEAAADPGLDLVLVHFPVPHPPSIYQRRTGEFAWDGQASYLDDLVLMDRTVGELRKVLEAAGLWDSTSVLVTADHGYRTYLRKRVPSEQAAAVDKKIDHRVPFVLRLAGGTRAQTYDGVFNTVVTHDLLLSLLTGSIANEDQLVRWLDGHRTSPEELARQIRFIRTGTETWKAGRANGAEH